MTTFSRSEELTIVADRNSFLMRVDPKILEAIRRWADDDMRSMNGQIEFLLRNALKAAGRLPSSEKKKAEKPSEPCD